MIWFRLVCLMLAALCSGVAQTREEVDKQAFERFRLWADAQPIAVRGASGASSQARNPQLLETYRAHLKENGYSDAEIASQIEVVRQQGGRLEAERWNRYFTAERPAFNTKPNGFW